MTDRPKVIRDTDAEAIRLAKTLIRTARHGALAVLDPQNGAPLASRVGVATDLDGSPIVLVSMLSAHTPAMLADPRVSLLIGEPRKGDPLAHPRITLRCLARRLERNSAEEATPRRRYLNHHPKAELYAGLGDFFFFGFQMLSASLNAGFGKAYSLETTHLLCLVPPGLDGLEQDAVDHMNADHAEAAQLYARHFARMDGDGWQITGFDAEGIDLAAGDQIARVWFDDVLQSAADLRSKLAEMARAARLA